MSAVKKYYDFLEKRGQENPSDEKPFGFCVWPQWLGETERDLSECCVFMSFLDCVRALDLLVDMAPGPYKDMAAEDQIRFLEDNADEEESEFFLAAAFAGIEKKKQRPTQKRYKKKHVLFHRDGASETGTQSELSKKTGLAFARVSDVVNGRRQYASGWSLTKERALEGPRKPGRPRKTGS